MFCSHCGKELAQGARFCGNCGASADGDVAQPDAASYTPSVSSAQGATFYASPTNGAPGATMATTGGRRGTGKLVGGVIAAAVVVVIALVLVIGGGSGGGGGSGSGSQGNSSSSAQEVVDKTEPVFADFLTGLGTGTVTDASIESANEELLELFPPDAISAFCDSIGMTRDEWLNQYGSFFSSFDDEFRDSLSGFDIDISMGLGDALDSGDIDSINSTFEVFGLDASATAGYEIEMTMTLTATEDGEDYSSVTYGPEAIGMYAVEMGGKWYLWGW